MITYVFQFDDEAPTQWHKGFESEEAAHGAAAALGRGRKYRLGRVGPNAVGAMPFTDWITPSTET